MKTLNKGFAPIAVVLIILAVLVVGGGAYYIYSKNNHVPVEDGMAPIYNHDNENYQPINTKPTSQTNANTTSNQNIGTTTSPQSAPGQTNTQNQNFFVVGSDTGINVSNPTFVVGGNTYTSIATFLAYMHTLPAGLYNVDVSGSGYQTSNTRITAPHNLTNMVINLDPVAPAANCPTFPANANNFAICGYTADKNHNALGNVQVSSPNASFSLNTLGNGWYDTEFLANANFSCTNPFTFTFSKNGYKTLNYVIKSPSPIYAGGGINLNVLLTPGSGTEQKIEKHAMCP